MSPTVAITGSPSAAAGLAPPTGDETPTRGSTATIIDAVATTTRLPPPLSPIPSPSLVAPVAPPTMVPRLRPGVETFLDPCEIGRSQDGDRAPASLRFFESCADPSFVPSGPCTRQPIAHP